MESMKTFSFTDGTESLQVRIPEVVEPAYGMYVWPCAPVLAQYVWFHREKIQNKAVLEIGAGTALPGIVAAKCGGIVTLSDCASYPRCLDNCRRSCSANDVTDVSVVGLSWGEFTPRMLNLPPQDIILASDCFYASKDFEDIIATVTYLLEQNHAAEFWTSYQERSAERSIEYLLLKWKLSCTHVSLSLFQADSPCIAGTNLPGDHTIHMLIIRREVG